MTLDVVKNCKRIDKHLVSTQFKVAGKYGLIGGFICCLVITVLFWIDKHPFLVPIIFDFRVVLFPILIFFSLKEIRDYCQGGILFFWQGMIYSYAMLMTAALVASSFVWTLASWHSTFLSSYITKLLQQFSDNQRVIIENVGKEAYEQQLAKLPSTSAADLSADYFLKSMIIGLFLTIILSVILRKQPKTL